MPRLFPSNLIICKPAQYEIKCKHPDGTLSTIDHKGRTKFSRRLACNMAREIADSWGRNCELRVVAAED